MKYLPGLLLSAVLLLAGCGEEDDPTRHNDFVPLTGITIESTGNLTRIAEGTSHQFRARGDYSGVFTRDITGEVSWTSDTANLDFAITGSPGLAKAGTAGPANVMAALGDISATIPFNVAAANITQLVITPAATTVPDGRTVQFAAEGTFSDGAETFTQVITRDIEEWRSDAPAVATIDATGLATASGEENQTANITARFKGTTSPAAVLTVGAPEVDSIEVTPESQTILPAETQTFTATAVLSNRTKRSAASPSWLSSNTAVATIDANGKATSVGPGTTTITATAEGKSGAATLTIATLQSIVVTSTADSVPVDGTLQMTATGKYSSGPDRDLTTQVSWTSTNTNLATVSTGGTVTGKQTGGVAINAAKENVTGTKNITVTPAQ